MKPADIVVRCYAVRRGGIWSAICVDLSLAAQGSTYAEAKEHLHAQIGEYLMEALTVDKEHAAYLLTRKAPLSQVLTWHWLRVRSHLKLRDGARLFNEPYPVVPVCA